MVRLCSYVVRKIKEDSLLRDIFSAANIVSTHARKGFSVKLNVDAHWSCVFYKGLDYLQHKGGLDMTVLNRNNAAGFRYFYTLATQDSFCGQKT